MAADALAPCDKRSSPKMILTVWDTAILVMSEFRHHKAQESLEAPA